MNTDPSTPENEVNLSALGRELLGTNEGGKPSGPWVPPTAEELHKLLPEYEIVKMLGRGGMGAVYMGRQKSLDRPVAIKILSTDLENADPSFAERFKNEARAMGKLNHPGIVKVHDFGETAGGLLYIVMEYVEGTDVARMIAKEGRLHTEHAMAITAHVCDALAYAHERGIIHRDIKPANIMVGYDGVVKVADFGLAKMTHSNASGLTQSGVAMGTLHYMAPEALMLGSAVDHRADIYAVGVMLYQMLTGKLPKGMFELPSLLVPGLDPRYDGIIAKALREEREERYQSSREMRDDLDNILTQAVAEVEAPKENVPPAQTPAALPTHARPHQPGGRKRHQSPPPAAAPSQPSMQSSGAWPIWIVLSVLAVGGGLVWFQSSRASSATTAHQDETAVNKPPSSSSDGTGSSADTSHAKPQASQPDVHTLHGITKDKPFVNSLGMKFVPVPGTKVLFCIHETRRKDYAVFAAESSNAGENWKSQTYDGHTFTDRPGDHPVVNVRWPEAQGFCNWLSVREGARYRLPKDAEWSVAYGGEPHTRWPSKKVSPTGGGSGTLYPWGADWPPPSGSGNFSDQSRRRQAPKTRAIYFDDYDDGYPTTAPVMSYAPNRHGLFDMCGNVWEWVEERFDPDRESRIFRGASWNNADTNSFTLNWRTRFNAVDRAGPAVGFRVALELPQQ
ncbi:bifunctional serine/threonine-protein kinase/formylglycine-generating enzyme family protein [Prosthecobacter sp.]|uniref:bifunctional serine/threonine-protein kinase/formylglycine-generating enzyme family protein n=1 Tax=Prosthecobacter sp. TaxID=1965333 RepID=UPI001E040A85|nr:bifunctional serine/threonine-protein kinase/formylglycine-generating enzyme family protein [Prosthecobacter sp.]MCB1279285.1 protein kinase [Prosthecobacter sp.]